MMRDALDGAEEAKVLCERKRELGKDNVAAGSDAHVEREQNADECNKPFVAIRPILWIIQVIWTIPRNDI
jgi:hypothetical protein